jgi:hypothetical protein
MVRRERSTSEEGAALQHACRCVFVYSLPPSLIACPRFLRCSELSGRIINIVVSPASGSGNKDSLRLLNYLTAPNVLVWSAALASCAIPGIYAPVELLKKDETGKLSPYMEGGAPIKVRHYVQRRRRMVVARRSC